MRGVQLAVYAGLKQLRPVFVTLVELWDPYTDAIEVPAGEHVVEFVDADRKDHPFLLFAFKKDEAVKERMEPQLFVLLASAGGQMLGERLTLFVDKHFAPAVHAEKRHRPKVFIRESAGLIGIDGKLGFPKFCSEAQLALVMLSIYHSLPQPRLRSCSRAIFDTYRSIFLRKQ